MGVVDGRARDAELKSKADGQRSGWGKLAGRYARLRRGLYFGGVASCALRGEPPLGRLPGNISRPLTLLREDQQEETKRPLDEGCVLPRGGICCSGGQEGQTGGEGGARETLAGTSRYSLCSCCPIYSKIKGLEPRSGQQISSLGKREKQATTSLKTCSRCQRHAGPPAETRSNHFLP